MRYLFLILVFVNLGLLAKEYKVGFSQDTLANDWRVAQVEAVKSEVSKYPFLKLEVRDANSNLAQQITDIEYFINNNFDFIITSPINSKITALVLKKAIEKDIKVILIDRGIDTDSFTTFIAPDNYKIAKKAGEFIAKELGCSGTVLVLEGIKGASVTEQRNKGFLDGIKDCKNIKTINKVANFLRADAISVMDEIYSKNIKFDAIYSHSDSMLSGVRLANLKHKRKEKVLNVGIDYITEAKNAIIDGVQSASFTYDTCGKEGVESIVSIIDGKKVQKIQVLDSTMVTKENVKSVEAIF
jgi:ribose transport system substrate-binding protein